MVEGPEILLSGFPGRLNGKRRKDWTCREPTCRVEHCSFFGRSRGANGIGGVTRSGWFGGEEFARPFGDDGPFEDFAAAAFIGSGRDPLHTPVAFLGDDHGLRNVFRVFPRF